MVARCARVFELVLLLAIVQVSSTRFNVGNRHTSPTRSFEDAFQHYEDIDAEVPEQFQVASNSGSFVEEEQGIHPISSVLNPMAWSRYMSNAPDPRDVASVTAWGQTLNMDQEELDAIPNMANPAEKLYDAAVKKYESATDPDEIVMSMLEALHFKLRQSIDVSQYQFHLTRADVFKELADDYEELQELMRQQVRATAADFGDYNSTPSRLGPSFTAHMIGKATKRNRHRPAALVFTCSFGGGHKSAGQAVQKYLDVAGYDSTMIDTTRDVHFVKGDLGLKLGDNLFNKVVLQKQWYRAYNVMDKGSRMMGGVIVKPCSSPSCDNSRKSRLRNAVLAYNPDLLVSVYHMEMMTFIELAKELGNLPYIHIATDIDIKMHEVFNTPVLYPRFLVGVPFNLASSWSTIQPLERAQTFLAGYPVRAPFLQPRDDELVKRTKEERYPADCRLILVMSGGGGQKTPWPAIIANHGLDEESPRRIHIVVVAGNDATIEPGLQKKLRDRIIFLGDKRQFMQGEAKHVTVEVARGHLSNKPFFIGPEELALLMDMSDLVITKPGGGSTAELAYRGTPGVFDAHRGLLHWEEFTALRFEELHRGLRLHSKEVSEVQSVCKQAMAYGRDLVVAEEEVDGIRRLIDPEQKMADAVEAVMATVCDHCTVF